MTYEDSRILARSSLDTFESVDATLILSGTPAASDPRLPAGIRDAGICSVAFVPARFTNQDIEAAKACDSYVMLQATEGVTGPRPDLDPENAGKINRLRAAGVTAPILLGFGISTADQAKAAIELGADGVVIGSMCLRKAREGEAAIRDFVRDVRDAIDA
jgi:tryptophan synthase alpha chain